MLDPRPKFQDAYKKYFREFKEAILSKTKLMFNTPSPTQYLSEGTGIVRTQLTAFLSGTKKISLAKLMKLATFLELPLLEREFLIKINAIIELNRQGHEKELRALVCNEDFVKISQEDNIKLLLCVGGDNELHKSLFLATHMDRGIDISEIASKIGVSIQVAMAYYKQLAKLEIVKIDQSQVKRLYPSVSVCHGKQKNRQRNLTKRVSLIETSRKRLDEFKENFEYYDWKNIETIRANSKELRLKVTTTFSEEKTE